MPRPVAALCFQLPASSAAELPPERLVLIPAPGADGMIRGVDGRAWRMPRPDAVVSAFAQPRAITENHAGQLAAERGAASPAFAWIESIAVESGAIVGQVTWTPRGIAAFAARDYRYLSPEFRFDAKTDAITALVGASLVNDPNFPQLALNHEGDHPPESHVSKAIAAALGLAESVDDAACITAINTLRTDRDTARSAAATPDPARFVLRAELDTALGRATTAEAALNAARAAQTEAAILQAVDAAQAAGKVIPATRDHYLALCRTDGGLELFNKLAASMPVIGDVTHTAKRPEAGASGSHGLTENQLAVCRVSGIDPAKYAESLKALAPA